MRGIRILSAALALSCLFSAAAAAGPARGDSVVIGDSLAKGVRDACRLTGNAVVGRGPQEILDVIRMMTPAAFAGKHVILSSGASNNPAAAALVTAQLAEIKKRGAASITVLGVGTRGDFAGVNDMLRAAARDAGADFMPIGPVARDMTHPQSYRAIGNAIFTPGRC